MGAWGADIFEDDFALDVQGDYEGLLNSGLSHERVTKTLMQQYSEALEDPEDSGVFWLALASIQVEKYDALQENVKNNALDVINSNRDLLRWEDSPDATKRKQNLDRLKNKILQIQH